MYEVGQVGVISINKQYNKSTVQLINQYSYICSHSLSFLPPSLPPYLRSSRKDMDDFGEALPHRSFEEDEANMDTTPQRSQDEDKGMREKKGVCLRARVRVSRSQLF